MEASPEPTPFLMCWTKHMRKQQGKGMAGVPAQHPCASVAMVLAELGHVLTVSGLDDRPGECAYLAHFFKLEVTSSQGCCQVSRIISVSHNPSSPSPLSETRSNLHGNVFYEDVGRMWPQMQIRSKVAQILLWKALDEGNTSLHVPRSFTWGLAQCACTSQKKPSRPG